jgi:AP-1 complex subunit gamma-1
MGDEIPTSGGQSTSTNGSAATAQSAQDLLANIFGDSTPTQQPQQANKPASQQRTVDDILGLFDAPAPSAPATAPSPSYTSPAAASLFSSPVTSPVAQVPQQAPAPRPSALPSYTAYGKNELEITLTPQVSPAKPGVVNILAKFRVMGANVATNVTFQAAVPKVRETRHS